MTKIRENAAAVPPVMVSREDAARMLSVNVSTWDRKVAAGKTPAPVKFGGRTLFRRTDLERWMELGCPERTVFETLTRKK